MNDLNNKIGEFEGNVFGNEKDTADTISTTQNISPSPESIFDGLLDIGTSESEKDESEIADCEIEDEIAFNEPAIQPEEEASDKVDAFEAIEAFEAEVPSFNTSDETVETIGATEPVSQPKAADMVDIFKAIEAPEAEEPTSSAPVSTVETIGATEPVSQPKAADRVDIFKAIEALEAEEPTSSAPVSTVETIGATEPVSQPKAADRVDIFKAIEALEAEEPTSSAPVGTVETIGATEPVRQPQSGTIGAIGATVAISKPQVGSIGTIGVTEPVRQTKNGTIDVIGVTEPIAPRKGSIDVIGPTVPISPKIKSDAATSATVYGGSKEESAVSKDENSLFVGWLVCISGANKGKEYKVRDGYNYIGSSASMDIYIEKDDSIASERAAVIGYDSYTKTFFLSLCGAHTIIRVNSRLLMEQVSLQAYDELTIGETKMIFVPLCGDKFNWD